MKRFFPVLLLMLVMMVSSCSSVDENLRAMVPDDAAGVVIIDVPTVLSKGGMLKGEAVELPATLKSLIEESAPSVIGDVVNNLSAAGFDMHSSSYIFFSPGIFKVVALIPLADDDATAKVVAKIAGGKMKDVGGVDFASHLDYAYVIDDDVLLIGRYSTPVEDAVAAGAAADILNKKKPSLFAREEVDTAMSKVKGDVRGYIDVKALSAVLKSNSRFSTIFGSLPLLEIVTDSDIKAMTLAMNFDVEKKEEESVKINTKFVFADGGQYSTLYDNLIMSTAPDTTDVLALIPGDEDGLDTYLSMRIDGSKLAGLPQMERMEDVIAANPMLSGLNVDTVLNSIKGNLVVGFGNNNADDMNFTVATQSPTPHAIVEQVINLATRRGQTPMQKDGEYVYDHGRQGIAMGEQEGAFYLYCVDFDPNYSATQWPLLSAIVAKDVISFFTQVKAQGKVQGTFGWGLSDKTNGEGLYFTNDPAENVVVSLLKYLCWADPTATDDSEDNFDYGF